MEYRVDEKGKVFTERITKRAVPVVACIGDLIVRGTVHLKPDNRLKDELNDNEQFIAITQAHVLEHRGKRALYKTEALIVNKSQIAWIFPRKPDLPE
jgi:hypothetical protein